MKKFLWIGLVVAVAAVIVAVSCSKKSTDSGGGGGMGTSSWTVMVYGAGNNNLDTLNNATSYIIQDVQDMEKVGSQSGMTVIAMVTSYRTNRAKYYRVEYYPSENPDALSSTVLEDLGSKDMSDPATLRSFLNYCKANYPAQRYLLIIDDHGAGWPGSCTDDLNGSGGELTMPELKNAIAQSDIQHVDIVTFHACLMAMVEVGYELRNVASYMTASQFTMPMENVLAADLWLGWLKDNLGATPSQVAHKIAESVPQRAEYKQKTTHYAMIDLSQMTSMGSKIGNFGNTLVQESGNYWSEVLDALSQTHGTPYDNLAYTDLREFANKVKSEEHLSQINLIRNGADSIIAAINMAVPYTNVYIKPGDPNVTRGGLNIHFPYQAQDFDSANYVTLEFRPTNWHSFLSTFLQSLGGVPVGQCPTTCPEALEIPVGTPFTQCQLVGTDSTHWFKVHITTGTYRFQLADFGQGADFDLLTGLDCNTPIETCYGANDGPEDFSCSFQGSGYLILLVYRYSGSGGYTLLVTQTGFTGQGGSPLSNAKHGVGTPRDWQPRSFHVNKGGTAH